jgi:hypothetical protein
MIRSIITTCYYKGIDVHKNQFLWPLETVSQGVNNDTGKNVGIVVSNADTNQVVKNMTMDLWAEAQKQYPGDSNPPALKVPIPIEADAVKVCATELDTGKAAVEGQQRKVLRQ